MKSYKTSFQSTTLLITLKDNSNFTKRLIKYLNLQSIKIKILVADGSKSKQKNLFKKLKHKYNYFYFGEDENLNDYYNKIYLSLKKINTKFIFFCDQDDLINFSCLQKKEKFLIANKKFSAAKGILYNFKNYKKDLLILSNKSYVREANNKKILFKRIIFNFHFRSYYCLHRKKNLIKIFKIITNNNIYDVRSAEFIMDLSTLISGQIYLINQCSVLRWSGNKYDDLHPIKKHDDTRFSWFFKRIYKNDAILTDITNINNKFNLNIGLFKIIIIFFDIFPVFISRKIGILKKILNIFFKSFESKKRKRNFFFKMHETNKIVYMLNKKLSK